jgi:oxygen-independent coproporphyrinogen-3 oxidase
VSYGVQDHDPEVQRVINRIQPLENVQKAVNDAREIGYTSVNFDLIYGLPKQTLLTMQQTIEKSIALQPDRIAFYSYAHVPWTSKAQRLFDESDLPAQELKMELYQLGKKLFLDAGYVDIGMDHFSKKTDTLNIARTNGGLHRNFMGYTTQHTTTLLGLGVSSISDAGNAYMQNEKTLHDYEAFILEGKLPVTKGYILNDEELRFKKYILDISCKGRTIFDPKDVGVLEQFSFPVLQSLAEDGLVTFESCSIQVTPLGNHFIRNICRAFDLQLLRATSMKQENMFSKAI